MNPNEALEAFYRQCRTAPVPEPLPEPEKQAALWQLGLAAALAAAVVATLGFWAGSSPVSAPLTPSPWRQTPEFMAGEAPDAPRPQSARAPWNV